uniref:Reverse transcriptase RNase H-like domain-containing protein n=1 Tax=Lactuca sativa TaxID=4236 RepID=A0A9R1WLS8_LACSA|nr:hypothetical protein LSAT_V11C100009940 [Lactuca sativa]
MDSGSERGLEKLNDALQKLPALASPLLGEMLQMYLAASKDFISSVLVVEREGKKIPIHFVSRALQGPEGNYPALEKLVIALVYAVRRLRRYFQAHKVEVMTSYPIKQVLLRPKKSGRLAKWAIELGEHDIQYHPKTSIKPHALTDFLVEILDTIKGVSMTISVDPLEPEVGKEIWNLYIDGATSKEGSGAGLILQSPKGEEITYALRFVFQVSNNEAEYKALLTGLRLAKEVGAK